MCGQALNAFDDAFRPFIVEGDDLGKAYVWDETADTPAPAMALATMDEAKFPVPIGVFRRQDKPNFEYAVNTQLETAVANNKQSLKDLIYAGEIWDVE